MRKAPAQKKTIRKSKTPAPVKKQTTKVKTPVAGDVETNNSGSNEDDANNTPKTCAPKYKGDEDVQIFCSWLEITQDPLNSTNQTGDTFWSCVFENYLLVINTQNCTFKSIKSR